MTTTTLPPLCAPDDPAACDDGEPCTTDACLPVAGCSWTPVTGLASVTCTCLHAEPAACGPAGTPKAVRVLRERACRLFGRAGSGSARAQRRRLVRGAALLRRASARTEKLAARGRLAEPCAAALRAELADSRDRARALAGVQ